MFQAVSGFITDQSSKNRNRKWIVTAIVFGLLVTIAIFVIPWKDTWQTLQTSDLRLIAIAFLLVIPSQLLSAMSYHIVASSQDATFNYWQIFKINIIMVFYDLVLPSTFFVSGIRWYRYNQHAKKTAETLTSIAYLKAYRILLTILLSVGLLIFFDTTSIRGYYLEISLLILAIIFILFFLPLVCKTILRKIPQPDTLKNNRPFIRLIFRYFYKALSAFANFQNLNLSTHFKLIVLGLATQGVQYYSYVLFSESVGIHLTFGQLGVMSATLMLVANLPINFSVGITMKDVTLVSILVAINVPLEQAAAMSIVVIAKNFFFGIVGGIIEASELVKRRIEEKKNIS